MRNRKFPARVRTAGRFRRYLLRHVDQVNGLVAEARASRNAQAG